MDFSVYARTDEIVSLSQNELFNGFLPWISGIPKMSSSDTMKRLSGHKPLIDVDLLDEPGDRYQFNEIKVHVFWEGQ